MNLQNLIDFGKWNDIDVLEGVNVPAPLSVETMKNAIMIRCGLLTPVYGEPDLFRDMVKHWFTVKQWTIEHLIKVVQAEYSPIENYDRYEEWDETHAGTVTDAGNSSDKHSGSDTRKQTGNYTDKNSGSDTEENTVSAYNSSSYQPDTKRVDTAGKTLTNTHADDETYTHGEQIARTNDNVNTRDLTDKHTGHLHGNIGIVTNQKMIEEELELLRHFDIYGYIAERFEEDNMLMIY